METKRPKKVLSSTLQTDKDGLYILCTMDDLSLWRCNIEGNDWSLVKPSDEFLNKKLNNELDIAEAEVKRIQELSKVDNF